MARPDTYEDTMRVHDVAFYNWLGTLLLDYKNLGGSDKPQFPILRVYSSPQRAYADVVDLLVEQGFVEGDNAAEMRANAKADFAVLPLPIATLERDEPVSDPELPGTPVKEIRTLFWNTTTGQLERHPFPAHYKTEYRVTFWFLKKYTDAYIREWIYGQLGNRGAAENEMFIPVVHDEPWGTILHSLKMTGSSDLSDLEGEGARYFRKEFTFSLRTWIMKPETTEGGYPVEVAGTDSHHLEGDEGALLEASDLSVQSFNLFRVRVPLNRLQELWPLEGDATIEESAEFPEDVIGGIPLTFRIGVAEQADKAHILETPSILDGDGLDLFSLALQYQASGRVEVEFMQRDLGTESPTSADSLILPATSRWAKVHYFTLVDKAMYIARLAGIGNQDAQEVLLSQLDVRHIFPQTKVTEDDQIDLGTETKYRWFSLAREPYLCIISVTATTSGSNIVTVEDDAGSPAYTSQRVVDSSVHVGAVFLVQPKTDSLALRVPKTTTVSAVYIQRFSGSYKGHSIQ